MNSPELVLTQRFDPIELTVGRQIQDSGNATIYFEGYLSKFVFARAFD